MSLTMEDCRILAYRMETMDEEMLRESYSAIAEVKTSASESNRAELDAMLQSITRLLLERQDEGPLVRERRSPPTRNDAFDLRDTQSIEAEAET